VSDTNAEWIPTAAAARYAGLSIRALRVFARNGKVDFRVGRDPCRPRYWYHAPELQKLTRAFALRADDSMKRKMIRPVRKYSYCDFISKGVAAQFIGCRISQIKYLVSIGRLGEYGGGLMCREIIALYRTLQLLAKNGKLNSRDCRSPNGRKFWFHKNALRKLLQNHTMLLPNSASRALSGTIRSQKIAALKYPPGVLVTKADAALILGCSLRGVEYLMSIGRLKSLKLGHRVGRRVVFKQKSVLALQRRRIRTGRKTGVRKSFEKTSKRLLRDLTNSVGIASQKVAS
jgi:hypothetical protein